jgi:spore coat protein JC
MWIYEKKLQIDVDIKTKDLPMAKFLMAQYGGPDGELSAALRYQTQRYSMPTGKSKAICTDIGTEEMAHLEVIATMIYQLTRDVTPEELREAGLGGYYVHHNTALYYADANGVPWTAAYIQSTGDPITDLHEDMAAEQKARTTYEHLIHLTKAEDIIRPLRFLWQREVVHFQRFGEALVDVQDYKVKKKHY